jgi:glycosyltransferase involved in cell wall biosynthesis
VAAYPLRGPDRPLRILVVTRSYPSAGDLYQYPFVHRRILAYRAAGHEVAVFRPAEGPSSAHEYEGVTCKSGDGAAALLELAREFGPEVIAAHGFSEAMWPLLSPIADVPIRAWLHGSEIPAVFRQRSAAIADPQERADALAQVELRRGFWLDLLDRRPARLELVLPSRSAAAMMREDVGQRLGDDDHVILPNPIDTDLFRYQPKSADLRLRILSIRPFDSPTRANDLSVAAIRLLSKRPGFGRLQFTIIGDGRLFDEELAPLGEFGNVRIRRQFLTQAEIVEEHARHGIFLVPTRLDTQGVSRDEAMASGLVPVTSDMPTVREFADETCAAITVDEPAAFAAALWEMIEAPELFLRRSAAAAARVRTQTSHDRIIPDELALLADAADG